MLDPTSADALSGVGADWSAIWLVPSLSGRGLPIARVRTLGEDEITQVILENTMRTARLSPMQARCNADAAPSAEAGPLLSGNLA